MDPKSKREKMSKQEKFSIINTYERLGLIKGPFNESKKKFDKKFTYNIQFGLALFSLITLPIKMYTCLFFDEKDPIQFKLGDWFNQQMDPLSRSSVSISCIYSMWTILLFMFTLRLLNDKREKKLTNWMKIVYIIEPIDDERPDKELENFWINQHALNIKLNKFLDICSICCAFLLAIFIFRTKFEMSIFVYLFFGILHFIHDVSYMLPMMNIFANINIFTLSFFKFFKKRFEMINLKLDLLIKKRKLINNQTIQDIIYEFNLVIKELNLANEYWKIFFGVYLVVIVMNAVLLLFLILIVDFKLKIVLSYAFATVLSLAIVLPYHYSNQILKQMKKTRKTLQNLSFHSSLGIKKQIQFLSYNLRDEKNCFTCFDLFTLNLYNSYLIIMNLISYVLMLLKVSQIGS